jgi:hypothetical protein
MPLDPRMKKNMAPKVSSNPGEAIDPSSQDLHAKAKRAAQKLPAGGEPAFVHALCGLFSSLPNMTADELNL